MKKKLIITLILICSLFINGCKKEEKAPKLLEKSFDFPEETDETKTNETETKTDETKTNETEIIEKTPTNEKTLIETKNSIESIKNELLDKLLILRRDYAYGEQTDYFYNNPMKKQHSKVLHL